MFIKIHVKNSVDALVPIMVNTNLICTVEPDSLNRSFILFHDQRVLVAEETFEVVVTKLRMQGVFEV
jgi:hypothetical protein